MAGDDSPAPYPHWMLREIYEQPAALAATLEALVEGGAFREAAAAPLREWLQRAGGELVIAASGSSRHAGLVAELLLEDRAGMHTDVEYASEYVYRPNAARKNASVLVVSQSGETADTLMALRKAKEAGRETLAITNVPGSTMAREATLSMPTLAGREQAIPATKSFTAQLLNLYLLSLLAGEIRRTLAPGALPELLRELEALPEAIQRQLPRWERQARAIADALRHAEAFLFVGRGVHYPIAREGALKLKESSYLHAEGYPSGELKHGPNALVSPATPLMMLATVDRSDAPSVARYDKVVLLMEDMRRQGATIAAIANEGDEAVAALAHFVCTVDEASEGLLALCEAIPLQLFAYCMAVNRAVDVDHPRNLSKAVLAE